MGRKNVLMPNAKNRSKNVAYNIDFSNAERVYSGVTLPTEMPNSHKSRRSIDSSWSELAKEMQRENDENPELYTSSHSRPDSSLGTHERRSQIFGNVVCTGGRSRIKTTFSSWFEIIRSFI